MPTRSTYTTQRAYAVRTMSETTEQQVRATLGTWWAGNEWVGGSEMHVSISVLNDRGTSNHKFMKRAPLQASGAKVNSLRSFAQPRCKHDRGKMDPHSALACEQILVLPSHRSEGHPHTTGLVASRRVRLLLLLSRALLGLWCDEITEIVPVDM